RRGAEETKIYAPICVHSLVEQDSMNDNTDHSNEYASEARQPLSCSIRKEPQCNDNPATQVTDDG
ncbi:MAG: hypothetical protein P1R74_08400, partial [Sedimenticola sp.]|nr:hypothetical protein [Sedimenticola sp.]